MYRSSSLQTLAPGPGIDVLNYPGRLEASCRRRMLIVRNTIGYIHQYAQFCLGFHSWRLRLWALYGASVVITRGPAVAVNRCRVVCTSSALRDRREKSNSPLKLPTYCTPSKSVFRSFSLATVSSVTSLPLSLERIIRCHASRSAMRASNAYEWRCLLLFALACARHRRRGILLSRHLSNLAKSG